MKHLSIAKVFTIFLLLSLIIPLTMVAPARAQDVSIDQQCGDQDDSSSETVGLNGRDEQIFIPTQNRLVSIGLKLSSPDILTNDTPIILKVLTYDNPTIIGTATIYPKFEGASVIRIWTFSPEITVTPGTKYKMYLQKPDPAKHLSWYTQTPGTCDGKADTYAIQGGLDYTGFDFVYFNQGYTYTAPIDAGDGTTVTPGTTAGQTAGTGDAPATATSAAIKAPTGIIAEYRADVAAVNISWIKSTTTDIDGYKVFRSETKTSGFKEISKTLKATTEYLDGDTLTVGKTYYYVVRAYKGTDESVSSSAIEITIPTATTVAAETVTKHIPIPTMSFYNKGAFDEQAFYSLMLGSAFILFLLLVWYEIKRAQRGEFLKGNHFKIEK